MNLIVIIFVVGLQALSCLGNSAPQTDQLLAAIFSNVNGPPIFAWIPSNAAEATTVDLWAKANNRLLVAQLASGAFRDRMSLLFGRVRSNDNESAIYHEPNAPFFPPLIDVLVLLNAITVPIVTVGAPADISQIRLSVVGNIPIDMVGVHAQRSLGYKPGHGRRGRLILSVGVGISSTIPPPIVPRKHGNVIGVNHEGDWRTIPFIDINYRNLAYDYMMIVHPVEYGGRAEALQQNRA